MHHLTRRTLATTACAGALLFGAAACGDDDAGVEVNVDEEQVEENLDDAGEDVSEGFEDLTETVDENVDIGDNAGD